jgi:hypothetical protein
VRQGDAERRIDVKRLSFGGIGAAGGGVADMADADVAVQIAHVAGADHIADQTVILAQKQATAVTSHNARCVLSPMLQHSQAVEQALIDCATPRNTDDSAHSAITHRNGRQRPSEETYQGKRKCWASSGGNQSRSQTAPS